jgi:hypothetical protein
MHPPLGKIFVLSHTILLSGLLCLETFGCASTRIDEHSAVLDRTPISNSENFFLVPLRVIAFGFYEEREIRIILEEKIRFEISTLLGVRMHDEREEADNLIVPELIVKRYEKKYEPRYYYRLGVSLVRGGRVRARFSYEYSGSRSIFETKVHNLMLEKLMKDIKSVLSL